jgi:hypothetical protein
MYFCTAAHIERAIVRANELVNFRLQLLIARAVQERDKLIATIDLLIDKDSSVDSLCNGY